MAPSAKSANAEKALKHLKHSSGSSSLPTPTTPTTTGSPAATSNTSLMSNGIADLGSGEISADVLAVATLLNSMKGVMKTVNSTFDILAHQTQRAATLGPTLKLSKEFCLLRDELEGQKKKHLEEIEKLKMQVQKGLKTAIEGSFKEFVDKKVQELTPKRVEERVRSMLLSEIPPELRERLEQQTRQRLEIEKKLHNSDARRYNSILKPSSTNPLRPLKFIRDYSLVVSDVFPCDMSALFNLSLVDATKLLDDYGLNPDCGDKVDDTGIKDARISKIMAFIGVFYQIRTGPRSAVLNPGGRLLGSPLVTRGQAALTNW